MGQPSEVGPLRGPVLDLFENVFSDEFQFLFYGGWATPRPFWIYLKMFFLMNFNFCSTEVGPLRGRFEF